MKTVYFEPSGLRLSKIAFGCAPVMGRIGRAQSLRAMQIAFDSGITHFDVARSYGYGEAEHVLGAFAAGKRDRITIATKFGINPPRQQKMLRLIKPLVRQIARHARGLRSLVRSASTHTLTPGAFDIQSARRSFDDSLRALHMEYVDILFLHDCSPGEPLRDDLLSWLENLVRAGRTRTWGIATHREWVDAVYAALPFKPGIVQCGGGAAHGPSPVVTRTLPAILHSPFNGAVGGHSDLLRASRAVLAFASRKDAVSSATPLSQLLLESALHLAQENVVLCSMFDPPHIHANVAAVEHPRFTREEVDAFIAALHTAQRSPAESLIALS
jgi:aryl-alcohol dehydrogenase-like predicted oxidoreductase